MKTPLGIAAALPMLVSATAALAVSYTGHWPFTVTRSQRADANYCLRLNDDGSLRFPHSGPAALTSRVTGSLRGTFQVIGGFLTVTIEQPNDSGQNAGLVFVAHASNGQIGNGVYDQVYGGQEFDSGAVAFGPKGGC